MTLRNTNRANFARAFVEGLLCSQRDCLELIRSLGAAIERILLIGGGRNRVQCARWLTVLGMEITCPATDEYVAIGAARQAAWVLSGVDDAPDWPISIDAVQTGTPTPQIYEAYVQARG